MSRVQSWFTVCTT